MSSVPHLAIPVRFVNSQAVAVEQDSRPHIAQRIEATARTPTGWRDDDPRFGVPQQVFANTQVDMGAIRAALKRCEPAYEGALSRVTNPADLLTDRLEQILDDAGVV